MRSLALAAATINHYVERDDNVRPASRNKRARLAAVAPGNVSAALAAVQTHLSTERAHVHTAQSTEQHAFEFSINQSFGVGGGEQLRVLCSALHQLLEGASYSA